MQEKILVVDDEREIADLIELYLTNEGYVVKKCYCATDALQFVNNQEMDAAILDVMLPDMSGFDLCRIIREKHTYPILMLTAKDGETEKITGLTLGADDYVTKPFRPLELVARVKAQLRRYKRYNTAVLPKDQATLAYRGLELHTKTHRCLLDGEEILLTPTEFSILRILLENKGAVVSAEELFRMIWKDEYYSKNSNTITAHIRHLREKLKDSFDEPRFIKTIWGVGYKIENEIYE